MNLGTDPSALRMQLHPVSSWRQSQRSEGKEDFALVILLVAVCHKALGRTLWCG